MIFEGAVHRLKILLSTACQAPSRHVVAASHCKGLTTEHRQPSAYTGTSALLGAQCTDYTETCASACFDASTTVGAGDNAGASACTGAGVSAHHQVTDFSVDGGRRLPPHATV